MRRIIVPDEKIEKAWQELRHAASTVEDESAEASEKFSPWAGWMEELAETQPALSAFLGEGFQRVSPEGAELGYFASLVIWRAFVLFSVEPRSEPRLEIGQASSTLVMERYNDAWKWIGSLGAADAVLAEKKLRDPGRYDQPHLMSYVVDTVLDAHEDGIELDPRDQERLLVILRVVADTLAACLRMSDC